MPANVTNSSAERRLSELDIVLPRPPTPLGAYVEAVQAGNSVFLSGTLPAEEGAPKFLGLIGGEIERRRRTKREPPRRVERSGGGRPRS